MKRDELIEELAKNTIYHISWGDGDNSFMVAQSMEEVRSKFDYPDMINYIGMLGGLTHSYIEVSIPIFSKYIDEFENPFEERAEEDRLTGYRTSIAMKKSHGIEQFRSAIQKDLEG
jgi:hypothetical protein